MTSVEHRGEIDRGTNAIARVEQALQAVFRDGNGKVTAQTETELQNILHSLRTDRCNAPLLERTEKIVTMVASVSYAQRMGRPNLYASKMLRLKRFAASEFDCLRALSPSARA